jgi:NADH-quinone oxidoreductase subunit C
MQLPPKQIFDELSGSFPEVALLFEEVTPCIVVPPHAIKDVGLQLRDAAPYRFDYLMCLSGVDNANDTLGVVYHLYSTTLGHKLTLKVNVPKDNPHAATVERVWRTADWHEREAYDLFGIVFDGHHDLRRILLPDDWEGHPLRKDYQVPEYYNGMKVPY